MQQNYFSIKGKMTGNILIVDDQEPNRLLLCDLLEHDGYEVHEAMGGEEAIAMAQSLHPDAILLDVMMPGLDGYDTCRILKSHPKLKSIPVLLVTSLTDRTEKLVGLESGATDFITKPIDHTELRLRVRNAVTQNQLYEKLEQSFDKLTKAERLRDDLVHMIVHDMRNPLNVMFGYVQLMLMSDEHKSNSSLVNRLHSIQDQAAALIEMTSAILDVSKFESGDMKLDVSSNDIFDLTRKNMEAIDTIRGSKEVIVEKSNVRTVVDCDENLIYRVIQNLLSNALKYTPDQGRITITFNALEKSLRMNVTDTGPGIPEEYWGRIFEKFGQVEIRSQKRKYSSGLGLTFCKLAIEAHNGSIGIESVVGVGSTFWFELPYVMET